MIYSKINPFYMLNLILPKLMDLSVLIHLIPFKTAYSPVSVILFKYKEIF